MTNAMLLQEKEAEIVDKSEWEESYALRKKYD